MEIEIKEEKEILKRKIDIYFTLKIKCHIKLLPRKKGFINGEIVSPLITDGNYFMFKDLRGYPPRRIIIEEVFDIKDYEDPIDEVKNDK